MYGRDDARAVLREAARQLGLAATREHASGDQLDPWAISLAQLDHALEPYRLRYAFEDKTSPVDDSDVDVVDATVLADLSAAYERRLQDYLPVDYPGMLTLPLQLLQANSRALQMLQDDYRWILVDEYQDCCRLQASLLQQLTSRHQNLTVVGDRFQSIYRFRGADPRLLIDVPHAFTGAQVRSQHSFRLAPHASGRCPAKRSAAARSSSGNARKNARSLSASSGRTGRTCANEPSRVATSASSSTG